jgi:hypothetical protein
VYVEKVVSGEPQIDVLEERHVTFYDDTILAILVRMGGEMLVVVPVRPICQVLGIDWSSQRKRINRDEVLKSCVVIVTTQVPGDTQRREHVCLPLDYLHGWLFGITVSQVSEHYRERITLYRRECFRALSSAFQADLALPDKAAPSFESGMTLQQVRDLGAAIMQMAEQQMALEGRITSVDAKADAAHTRLDKAAEVVKSLQQRMGSVEGKLNPGEVITDEQAAEVSTQVRALAHLLTSRDNSKNHYQAIFGELYRRFKVSSYKRIRQEQYDAVLAFLDAWHTTAGAEGGGER